MTIVERQPPPSFQAAMPAMIPLNGPSIISPLYFCSGYNNTR